MARKIAPRSAAQYDNATHGRREGNMPPDDRSLNASVCRMNLIRPKYKEGPLVARLMPQVDYTDTSILAPGRTSTAAHAVSHFIVRAPMAKFIGLNGQGAEKFSFILYEPWLVQEKKRNNPYRAFYFACKEAHKAGRFGTGAKWDADWNPLMVGDAKGGAQISGPSACWFMQAAAVYQNGEKDYTGGERATPLGLDPTDDLMVIQVSSTAGDAFLDLLDVPATNIPEDANEEAEPWKFFKFGDPVGVFDPVTKTVKGGVLVTFFNPKKVKRVQRPNPKNPKAPPLELVDIDGKRYLMSDTSWDGKIDDVQGYEVAIHKSFTGTNGTKYTSDLSAEQVAQVFEKSQFWWDDGDAKGILRIPSVEEQCVMIAKAYAGVPKLLQFAWSDHEREFMTDEVKGILQARRSAVVPGGEDEYNDEQEAAAGGAPPSRTRARRDPTQVPVEEVPNDFGDEAEAGDEPAVEGQTEETGEYTEEEVAGDVEAVEEFVDGETEPETAVDAAEESVAEDVEAVAEDGIEPGTSEEDLFNLEPVADAGEIAEEDPEAFSSDFNEEDTTAPAEEAVEEPGDDAGVEEAAEEDPNEAQMRASIAAAKSRATKRPSAPAAKPVAAPAKPAAAPAKPAPKPVAAPAKPAPAPVKPAAAPAKPAVAKPAPAPVKPAAAKPAAAPAKPAPAPVKPAASKPAPAPAKPAAAAPKPAPKPAAAAPAKPAAKPPVKK